MIKKTYLITILGIVLIYMVGFVIAAQVINNSKDDSYTKTKDGMTFKSKRTIDFKENSNGFEINGVKFTNPNYVKTNKLEHTKNHTYDKQRFVPETGNTLNNPRNEVYTWDKKPTSIKEMSYFINIEDYVKYIGGTGSLDEIEELCKDGTNLRCNHYEYKYLILNYEDENFVLNTKKVGLETGDVYNIKQTPTGFIAKEMKELANDVVYSSGAITTNGTTTCDALFTFIKDSAPECQHYNQSQDLSNITSISLSCELHINGTLNECNKYSIEFLMNEIPSSTGMLFYYNNSRINMSYGAIKFSGNKTDKLGIVPIDEFVQNATQYFERFTISSDQDDLNDILNHMYVTGDHLDMVWMKPSAGITFTSFDDATMTGIGEGVRLYGGMIAFPLVVSGEIISDSSMTAINNYAYYIWGNQNQRIVIEGGSYVGLGTKKFIFNGGVFGVPHPNNNTFTFTDTTKTGFTGLMFTLGGYGSITILYTPNYIINASGTDEAVVSNITINSLSGGSNPDYSYNEITSEWNTPIVSGMFNYSANGGVIPIFEYDTPDYTARMTLTNSSYFPINSSLDVSTTTINGKKDMVKIPYNIQLNPNSDYLLKI